MALYTSSIVSAAPVIPAENPRSNGSSTSVRTSCPILNFPSSTTPLLSSLSSKPFLKNICRSSPNPLTLRTAAAPQKYMYPDPVPEFAVAESQRFKTELVKELSKEKETFDGDLEIVANVCTEIFSEFLHKEYGGPGTLLVEPFTDMLVALKEKKLPGSSLAARSALLWAQNYVDQDWGVWNSKPTPTQSYYP